MHTRWLIAVIALVAGCPAPPAAPPIGPPAEPPAITRLRAIAAGSEGAELAGIALARISASGAAWTAAVGCAHFAADGRHCARPLTADSLVRVASISKLITAIGVMRLVEAGQLDLDRDVSDYLGELLDHPLRNPAFADRAITLRQLLSHTASLRDDPAATGPPQGGLAALLDGPDRFDAAHPPDSYFHYDNLSYLIVGAVVERVTGERFDAYMSHAVLRPAGVVAGYGWATLDPAVYPRAATLYRKRDAAEVWDPAGPWIAQVDDAPAAVDIPPDWAPGALPALSSPHGGLRISAVGLAALIHAAIGGPAALPAHAWAALTTARFRASDGPDAGDPDDGPYRDYALGNHSYVVGGRALRAHFGAAYGLRAGALFDPATGEVWVYLITGYASPAPARADAVELPGLDPVEVAVIATLFGA